MVSDIFQPLADCEFTLFVVYFLSGDIYCSEDVRKSTEHRKARIFDRTVLISSGNGATGETANKRARRENSPAFGDGEQSSDMKRANREKLAFVLYRRLRDSRWEVRDSTLEFVGSLLQLCNQGKSWLITYLAHLTKNDLL